MPFITGGTEGCYYDKVGIITTLDFQLIWNVVIWMFDMIMLHNLEKTQQGITIVELHDSISLILTVDKNSRHAIIAVVIRLLFD